MYSASWCGVCRRAKQFFAANDLRYQEIDADTTPGAWQKIEQLSGRRAVPLIIVDGEQTRGGLSPSEIMRAASRSVERRLGVRGIQVKAN
jgi:glutaredoxin